MMSREIDKDVLRELMKRIAILEYLVSRGDRVLRCERCHERHVDYDDIELDEDGNIGWRKDLTCGDYRCNR